MDKKTLTFLGLQIGMTLIAFILISPVFALNREFAVTKGAQEDPKIISTGNIVKASTLETQNIETDINFHLEIPAANVSKDVIANVDPVNEENYGPIIENSVAHGRYTRLPDELVGEGNVYLFAHRAGYVSGKDVGFFKDLDQLKLGDKAYIEYNGKLYTFVFRESFIITPQDVWVYTAESEKPTLTLQTCEDGENLRLIVKFDLVSIK